MTYTKEEIHNMIRDYSWVINEIQLYHEELEDTEFTGVAQYGIEATMPKPQGDPQDTMALEIIRRDKKNKRVEKLENKVKFIQENMHKITDERKRVVLDHLLDGMSITKLAHHMGVSRKRIYELKEQIVDELVQK